MSTRRKKAAPAAEKPAPGGAPAPVPESVAAPPAPPTPVADGPLALGAALAIRDVAALLPRLRAAVEAGAVRVDAGELHRVDTAGLQLLLSARRTAAARGASFEWHATSPELVAAATRLGLADALALPAGG